MNHKEQQATIEKWFFLILAGVIFYLFWQIMKPFVLVLATAGIFAIVLSPLEFRLSHFLKHKHLSSAMVALGVVALVLVPIVILLFVMIDQANELLSQSTNTDWTQALTHAATPLLTFLPEQLRSYLLTYDLVQLRGTVASWAVENIGILFSSTTQTLMNTFLFFLALYYLLLERQKLTTIAINLSPFRDTLDQDLLHRLVSTVRSVVFGVLILAIIQGILATIGMSIFGIPGAVIWGAVTMVAALVPFVGTALVLVPAVLYLFFSGAQLAALGLLIWSVVCVGLADNIIGPYLIKGTTKMHVFMILLAVLGGLNHFGAIGVIIGPTILAGVLTLLELYQTGRLMHRETNSETHPA